MSTEPITALVTGTLSQVPVSRTTSKGGTMATASLAVEVGDGKPVYLGLLAGKRGKTDIQKAFYQRQ